jgi:hypothetical protein
LKHRVEGNHYSEGFDLCYQIRDDGDTTIRRLYYWNNVLSVDDPKAVTLILAISDLEKVKASVKSEEQKKLMIEAGVGGVPEMFYYKLVE